MKPTIFRTSIFLLAVGFFLCVGMPPADAYDKEKCEKYVKKLSKYVKPHKSLKFKTILIDIGKMDDVEGGMSQEAFKEALDAPFKDIGWTKKFIKYLNKVETNCTREGD